MNYDYGHAVVEANSGVNHMCFVSALAQFLIYNKNYRSRAFFYT